MAKRIVVIVNKDGEVKIDAQGFSGVDCEKATRELEKALGLEQARIKKPEYHQRTKVTVRQ